MFILPDMDATPITMAAYEVVADATVDAGNALAGALRGGDKAAVAAAKGAYFAAMDAESAAWARLPAAVRIELRP